MPKPPPGKSLLTSPREIRCSRTELRALFMAAGCDATGAAILARKAGLLVLRVDGLKAPAANILKQQCLSLGGDCAVHRQVILGEPDFSSAHLIGSEKQLRGLPRGLGGQPFGLKGLGKSLEGLLARLADKPKSLTLSGGALSFTNAPLLMGILNLTPDSFSDGGENMDPGPAVAAGLRMISEGADILDLGGESTRPGAAEMSADEEIARVLPVLRELARQSSVPISIDTRKARVAAEALAAGASIVNDVSALGDPGMATQVAGGDAALVLMHMRGSPETMQRDPDYGDPVDEIYRWLERRLLVAEEAGIGRERLVVDPGIGFGKRVEDNTALIRRLGEFHSLGVPLLLGASRKSFLGTLMGEPDPGRRLAGSLAAAARGAQQGVQILRVHDVAETRRFLSVWRPLTEDETMTTTKEIEGA